MDTHRHTSTRTVTRKYSTCAVAMVGNMQGRRGAVARACAHGSRDPSRRAPRSRAAVGADVVRHVKDLARHAGLEVAWLFRMRHAVRRIACILSHNETGGMAAGGRSSRAGTKHQDRQRAQRR